jgi:hypothetical protein
MIVIVIVVVTRIMANVPTPEYQKLWSNVTLDVLCAVVVC